MGNFEVIIAVIGIAIAPMGGVVTLWVSTSNRIKVLEVQMSDVRQDYNRLNEINTNLAALNENVLHTMKAIETFAKKMELHERRLTKLEIIQNNHKE